IPILNVLSTAMGIYRVQMALASMQGIVLTGVLARLRIALYSLLTAIGPLGWALIGLSVAVGAVMAVWNRYTASVRRAAEEEFARKFAEQQRQIAESAMSAA